MSTIAKWVFAVAVFSLSLYAQLSRGSITGVLTDSSGAVIPAAKVSVRNISNGAISRSTTNNNGQFTLPNLPPGSYEVVFEEPNFKRLVRSGIELGATEVARVDASMEVGAVTESVQVSAEAEKLQT
ncbi:MAG TPA: carboxypeptidase-like regulatory domain-containing protein, partial [Bryobacteraceae bacterium]|nr:carboxypeptidase-like regulatory domain-containing protein [Bryobacteraceae bacterium]